MVDARNKGDKAVDVLIVIIMIVIGIIMLYPMLYELMVSSAIRRSWFATGDF